MQDFMVELMEPTRIWKAIKAKQERLDRMNAAATDISPHMHADGISTHNRKSKIEEAVIKAEEIREEILDESSAYIDAQQAIYDRLEHMRNYYTECMYIETVFVWGKFFMGSNGRGSERTAKQVRRDALRIYRQVYNEMEGEPEQDPDGETIATDIVIECPK